MNTINIGLHTNFYEIRFLLHGDRDRYDSQEILYIVSESEQSNLWVAIARTVIETWRILDSKIADTIPKGQWASLRIQELILSNILDRIQPTLINPRLLSAQERDELLRQVSSFNRQDLWRSLKLHETTTGSFTQINEHTYRVNPNFDLDPLLAEVVILVQNTQRPDWIPEWTPQSAINFIVKQPNPAHYAEILLRLFPQATDEQKRILRSTSWLPLQSGEVVAPTNVVFCSVKELQILEEGLERILSIDRSSNLVTLSMLADGVRNALRTQKNLRDICTDWFENNILSFLLDQAYFPNVSNNCPLILDTLRILQDRSQTVSTPNFGKLQNSKWLIDIDNRPVTPQQVINYPELNREISEILSPKEIRDICDYVTPRLLQNDIDVCLNDSRLKTLFTSGEAALQQIGVVIGLVDNYWIGDLIQDNLDIRDFRGILDGFEEFPILTLTNRMSEEQFKEYFLPEILKPISNTNVLTNVLNWITNNHASASNRSVRIFNQYLTLACKYPQFRDKILPNIKLLNSLGQWENPSKLCDGKQFTGIILESILSSEQRDILASYLDSKINPKTTSGILAVSSSNSKNNLNFPTNQNANILEKYFRSWLPYISSELIGLFVCLLTGSDVQTRQLAQGYLQRRDFEELRDRLVFGTDVKSRRFVIRIVSDSNQTIEVQNLLDNCISAMRVSSENLEHIFIGNLNYATTQISLRQLTVTNSNSHQLKDILFRSVKKFGDITGSSQRIEEVWEDIRTSRQLDIEVTRKHILEDLRHTLDTLGVKNRNDELKQKLKRWEELRYQLTAEERQSSPALRARQSIKQEEISKTITEIENLVTNNLDVSHHVLESIRCKIGCGQYGYDVNSIPFELFQNADDALTELLGMTNNALDDRKRTFVFEISLQGLRIMHWGRPINVFNLPNAGANNDFSDRGFDRDLLKMLSFNISDKSENVTGKFGLGFKSVYLICNEPKVISGDMSFSIESGLLPVALPRTNQAEQDYQLIKGYKQSLTEIVPNLDGLGGTLIDLPFVQSLNTNPQEITHEFKTSLGLLLAFSRSLKKCKFADRSQDRVVDINWNATNLFNSNRIAVGQIKLNNEQGWQTHNTLCFQLDDAEIAIVFPQNLSDNRSPLKDIPTFWVTAPTKEKLSLRFAINGKFDITTGRTSLDRNSPNNLATAQNIGKSLADALIHLFDSTQTSLASLIEALQIDNNVSAYEFWQFICEVLVVDWLKKDLDESAKSILKAIFGQSIGQLITRHRALPNGLSGSYQCLVSVPDVKYVLQGFISKQDYEEYFRLITSWSGFQSNYSPNKVVNASNWEIVRRLLGSSISNRSPRTVSFHNILSWEIGVEDVNSITPDQASRVGEVLTDELLRKIQISESGEYQEIRNILQTALFCNQNGEYINPSNILICDAREREEQLLAAFAPNDRLLNENYIDSGRTFFLICRERRETISPEEMTGWAIRANTSEMQNAVLEYLNKGEKKQLFTEILKNSKNSIIGTWMENNQAIQAILTVNAYQLRVNEAIEGKRSWDQITGDSNNLAGYIPNNNDYEPNDIVLANPDDLLRRISEWWQDNYSREIDKYNQRLYPKPFDDFCNLIQQEDRSAWMMLFFLGFTHKMGRTKHESHRNFIRFCLHNGWWDIFSRPDPQNLYSDWMNVLDQYIDPQVDRTQWNYWMEKFPSIYRTARYLDQYIHIFKTIDQHTFINLAQITAPSINPAFQGSPLNAPPLNLGIGLNFVIRELVRLGVIHPKNQVIQHCFVPRYNVRRLLTRLGCSGLDNPNPTYSGFISSFLAEKINELSLNISPTFENAFDIPFELYSGNSERVRDLQLDSIPIREDYDFIDEDN
ncbi:MULTISPECIES: hypothetical protein [Pseudanabaena]|uniref:Uncharacterized protein n=2 Tax=Pseudanabaena TaxID=1152 RepID=L8N7B4_9CYAN|nr:MULTISPECIES: hypothetical protein [Pseudanabaena]ELS34123.1 hypothetical protein Pse7429DRAFT_0922 [Pseudanabaena biceps PCC 7429]MDG3493650.1 hypothetical protein [Pseudanabaena catenata USMAC16]